ncbi:MAG: DNA repair protein RecO [candidate division Zixibacteria bacterium]|nr:DNA repair protein RecO [candidate division Zixibacteria bacterium]MBU1469102.1 DNA repair protein RecO [candidate division Zixibacteria bacterium]MBU2624612.1 DNA repair protein RecO [candidate division Zixibacteria bacterium]
MSLHKTEAVILKNARSGESSLLVYCFLKDGGRQNLLAKGARNPKSVMVGRLEPFSHAEILYYQSDAEKLGIVSQAEVIRSNQLLSEDIRRLSHASAIVETLEDIVPQAESSEAVFDLLQKSFYQMNYCHGSKLEFIFAAFLLKLLSLSGFHPEFNRCVKTGEDLSDIDEALFSSADGGVVAASAADKDALYYKLNKGTRRVLNLILSSDMDKLGSVNFSNDQKKLVRAMLLKFLSIHTERAPKLASLDFLDRIKPAE